MSDPGSGARTPDEFVKRAPSVADTAAMATTGSTVALIAYYIGECLTAHHFVAPSNEMLIVIVGAVFPIGHLVYKVFRAKLDKWAAAQGVQF